ncbi:MAG: hypothetical protein ACXAAO_03260 [Candidatus Thorarchaeota archaeon]|jgi:hypothetical protein
MSTDIIARLQELFQSEIVLGYIHTKLPTRSLQTGWIEQGLISKRIQGQLRDKTIQESLVIPGDRFARLTRDMSDAGTVNIVVIGSKGLNETKFVAIISEYEDSQTLTAIQIQKFSPLEIIQMFLQGYGKKVSIEFDEPNLDYVEQMRLDVAERIVNDALVISLPKGVTKLSEWMKVTLNEKSSASILLRHGTSQDLVTFSALLTKWVNRLDLFRRLDSVIAACLFMKKNHLDICLWDSSQMIASFASIASINIEEVTRKYLVPLWTVLGDSFKTKPEEREVVVEPITSDRKKVVKKTKEKQTDNLDKTIKSLRRQLEGVSISGLEKRLDSLETNISTASESKGFDKVSLDALQSRMADNIDRIESISKRLEELEKRIKKISTVR